MKILIVAAHPDDEVLGCGGTIRRLIQDGADVDTLILGEGVTSRDEVRDAEKRSKEISLLKDQAEKAAGILGYKNIFFSDVADNRFDAVPLLDIVKTIEKVKKQQKPDIIFTHHSGDLNIDHRITHEAVLTATRPVEGETVNEIYSFEIPSSTEWNYPVTFSPNIFYDITKTLKDKIEAMKSYEGELKKDNHPRSSDGIKVIARERGLRIGVKYAEAFNLIRAIR